MKARRVALFAALFGGAVSLLCFTNPAAAQYYWDGQQTGTGASDGSGYWDQSTINWWNSTSGSATWADGNDACFGAGPTGPTAAGPYTVTLGANVNPNSITFQPTVDGTPYTIVPDSGGLYSVTLGGGGITANASATINAPVVLSSSQTWTIASSQTLNIGGSISGGYGLVETGGGTLTLGGENTYSSGTTINAGVLQAGNNSALGANTGALTVNGGTFDVYGYNVNVGALNGDGRVQNSVFGGTLTVGNGDASSTFTGAIDDGGNQLSLVKTGSGTFGLNGNVALAGAATVSGGGVSQSGGCVQLSTVVVDGGTYNLSGGSLSVLGGEVIGNSGIGSFMQSGGTHAVAAGALSLGNNAGSSGTYNLTGGELFATGGESIGVGGSGRFTHSGGTNTVSTLSIGGNGSYSLAGGVLEVTGNLLNQGVFSGGSMPATLTANGILDISNGTWQNLADISLNMTANSLLIVPAGFDTLTGFANYNTLGLTHTVGSTLTVLAGQGFGGSGSINDPVNCQGMISAGGGVINLNGGLTLSGTGTTQLGGGTLATENTTSGISGSGQLSAAYEYVGYNGTGTFTQSGGTNSVSNVLCPWEIELDLGFNSGSSGTYNLSGGSLYCGGYNGFMYVGNEYIGRSGSGSFTQSGGTNSVAGSLYLGLNTGSSGTYYLSGGLLAINQAVIGEGGSFTQPGGIHSVNSLNVVGGTYRLSGGSLFGGDEEVYGTTGSFTQSGGINAIQLLRLGAYGSGTYNLSGGGLLSAGTESVGYGDGATGSFTQSGGTNSASFLSVGGYWRLGWYDDIWGGGSGTYNLSGGGRLSAPCECIGYGAPGSFVQSGGTNRVSSSLYVGGYAYVYYMNSYFFGGGSGTYNLCGSGWLSAPVEYIGYGETVASRSRAEPIRHMICLSDTSATERIACSPAEHITSAAAASSPCPTSTSASTATAASRSRAEPIRQVHCRWAEHIT